MEVKGIRHEWWTVWPKTAVVREKEYTPIEEASGETQTIIYTFFKNLDLV